MQSYLRQRNLVVSALMSLMYNMQHAHFLHGAVGVRAVRARGGLLAPIQHRLPKRTKTARYQKCMFGKKETNNK